MNSTPWLLVAGDFAPHGGMDRAFFELAWHLADRLGRTVTLVAHRVAAALAEHPNVSLVQVSRPRGLHLLGQPLLDRAGRRAAARLTALHPDATVVVGGGNCGWPGAINWVHMVHAACHSEDAGAPLGFRLKNRLSRAYFRQKEAKYTHQARLVIANSEQSRRHLIDLVGVPAERVRNIYLGCDACKLKPASESERAEARRRFDIPDVMPAAAFVGALSYDANKGLDTLISALALLPVANRPLVLVAGGGHLDYWKYRAKAAGVADTVRFLGSIPDVPGLLAATDVLVSPTRYDGYGMGVHEALCRGLPALVTRRAGIAERYPSDLAALLLSDAGSAQELANRLKWVLDNCENLQPAVTAFGSQLLKRSWERMSADIVELAEAETESHLVGTTHE
jgi:glycosyltransferase involved in cell wall biosynthesis